MANDVGGPVIAPSAGLEEYLRQHREGRQRAMVLARAGQERVEKATQDRARRELAELFVEAIGPRASLLLPWECSYRENERAAVIRIAHGARCVSVRVNSGENLRSRAFLVSRGSTYYTVSADVLLTEILDVLSEVKP